MPRRHRWGDDDWPAPRRRKTGWWSTGRIVGVSLGGTGLLVAVVVTAVVLANNRRSGPDDDSGGGGPGGGLARVLKKPEGRRTVGHFEEVEAPEVVDRIWPRLVGRWQHTGADGSTHTYEFKTNYTFRHTGTQAGKPWDETYPVVTVRDDARTTSAKTDECYAVFYYEKTATYERGGGININVYPDGTLDIDMHRYRRVK
jgi:hypothetical protein